MQRTCERTTNLVPICKKGTECYGGIEYLDKNRFVCTKCLQKGNDEFAECPICSQSDDIAYHLEDLAEHIGKYACSEHIGEYDNEECNDKEGYIKYRTEDGD
jgi:Zn ribbon nucleic-acid-binding protein